MTVILGLNLTDSVVLAGDTRVTRMQGDTIIGTHDNINKIDKANGIFLAAAGDAGLAGSIIRELRNEAFTRRGIEYTKSSILDWLPQKVDDYWQKQGVSTFCTLLIAGSSKQRKQYIPVKLAKQIIDNYLEDDQKVNLGIEGSEKMMKLSEIANANTDSVRQQYFKTDLFAITIDFNGIRLTECPVGSHLIYGPKGLVQSDILPSDITRVELSDFENGQTNIYTTAYIQKIVEDRKLLGVGSDIVPLKVLPDFTAALLTGTVTRIEVENGRPKAQPVSGITVVGDRISRVDKLSGKPVALELVSEYNIPSADVLVI